MKRVICIVLCAVMLLSLCACGKKDEDRPKVKITGTTREVSNNGEDSREADSPETEEEFRPVVLYDDKYCTVTQTTAFAYRSCSVELTNKSEGIIVFAIGDVTYANGVWFGSNEGDHTKVEPGETKTWSIYASEYRGDVVVDEWDNIDDVSDKKIETSLRVAYDNGETGVYHETFEIVDTMVCVQDPGNTVSDKYQKTGAELDAYSGDGFEIVLIESEKVDDYYHCRFYVENKSDKRMFFMLGITEESSYSEAGATLTSEQRNDSYLMGYNFMRLVMPGMGSYMGASFSVESVDGYALSVDDVLTLHIPFSVTYSTIDELYNEEFEVFDTYTFDLTRDQLRGE